VARSSRPLSARQHPCNWTEQRNNRSALWWVRAFSRIDRSGVVPGREKNTPSRAQSGAGSSVRRCQKNWKGFDLDLKLRWFGGGAVLGRDQVLHMHFLGLWFRIGITAGGPRASPAKQRLNQDRYSARQGARRRGLDRGRRENHRIESRRGCAAGLSPGPRGLKVDPLVKGWPGAVTWPETR